jgi:hypothetical protein
MSRIITNNNQLTYLLPAMTVEKTIIGKKKSAKKKGINSSQLMISQD